MRKESRIFRPFTGLDVYSSIIDEMSAYVGDLRYELGDSIPIENLENLNGQLDIKLYTPKEKITKTPDAHLYDVILLAEIPVLKRVEELYRKTYEYCQENGFLYESQLSIPSNYRFELSIRIIVNQDSKESTLKPTRKGTWLHNGQLKFYRTLSENQFPWKVLDDTTKSNFNLPVDTQYFIYVDKTRLLEIEENINTIIIYIDEGFLDYLNSGTEISELFGNEIEMEVIYSVLSVVRDNPEDTYAEFVENIIKDFQDKNKSSLNDTKKIISDKNIDLRQTLKSLYKVNNGLINLYK